MSVITSLVIHELSQKVPELTTSWQLKHIPLHV
jgi:hypothetical protein